MTIADVWNQDLYCRLQAVRVVADGVIALEVPRNNCTDMGGAIRVAQGIMPEVRVVHVISGGAPDITYQVVNGDWQAFDRRGP